MCYYEDQEQLTSIWQNIRTQMSYEWRMKRENPITEKVNWSNSVGSSWLLEQEKTYHYSNIVFSIHWLLNFGSSLFEGFLGLSSLINNRVSSIIPSILQLLFCSPSQVFSCRSRASWVVWSLCHLHKSFKIWFREFKCVSVYNLWNILTKLGG